MSIVAILKRENGEQLRNLADPAAGTFDAAGDFDDLLHEGDSSFALMKYVDRHGDTIFNTVQMSDLLADLDRLMGHSPKAIERRGLGRLRVMAELCRIEPHVYLWFIGD